MDRDTFFKEFRHEHREIRDLLFSMITSFGQRDLKKAEAILLQLNKLTGPHFRYEEEALYPALVKIYGESYIQKLLTDHDLLIARARKLKSTIDRKNTEENDISECISTVRAMLPHVSDCEGLTIMVEKLHEDDMEVIYKSMHRARAGNLSLMEWADTTRDRKQVRLQTKS